MVLGHAGAALIAKRFAPETNLAWLLLAAALPDMLLPLTLSMGWDALRIVPGFTAMSPIDLFNIDISHSLIMVSMWAIVAGVIFAVVFGNSRAAFVVFALVLSHWFLDLVTHVPDLRLAPGIPPALGFGLNNHFIPSIVVELLFFSAGAMIYFRSTVAKNWFGVIAVPLYLVFLLFNFASRLNGPPPPGVDFIVIFGAISWFFLLWPFFGDRYRAPRETIGPKKAG
jgi:hypothetical protein